MNIPFDIPITLPLNTNAMLGQMDMQQLHVLGLLLVVGLAVACAVMSEGPARFQPAGNRGSRSCRSQRSPRSRPGGLVQ
jgi:hypothetical protein